MCYGHSFMLFSHAIIVKSLYRVPNLHLITYTNYPIVLLIYLVGCTFHFIFLKRHLNVVFNSILFSVRILFNHILSIRILLFIHILFFIRILFSFIYHSFVYFFSVRIPLIDILFFV